MRKIDHHSWSIFGLPTVKKDRQYITQGVQQMLVPFLQQDEVEHEKEKNPLEYLLVLKSYQDQTC